MEGCNSSDLTPDLKESRSETWKSVPKNNGHWGKMNTYNNRPRCEFVRTKADACDGCIFSVAQNMTVPVWQEGHRLLCKT